MPQRCLFGPVRADFAERYLYQAREDGDCLAFNATGEGVDLRISADDAWSDVEARLPENWRPDFLALWLPYTTIPESLWTTALPRVGLAGDWNLLYHHYRRCLPRCELVLVDKPGVDVLTRDGLPHVRAANLYGLGRDWLGLALSETSRDIDVLFVGNLNAAVQRERMPWLGRLSRFADRRNVSIRTGVFGAEYRSLLARSRLAFNCSIRGECNQRAFEAAATGAMLLQEEGNSELSAYFEPNREFVFYAENSLESVLKYYLDQEDERRAVAEAAYARVQNYSFANLWRRALDVVAEEWDEMQERLGRRKTVAANEALLNRAAQALAASERGDSSLAADLRTAAAETPTDAALHQALALVEAMTAGPAGDSAAACFARAAACAPERATAHLNHAEALARTKHLSQQTKNEAATAVRRGLAALERANISMTDDGHYPPGFDVFRVEWERAAWGHAGDLAAELQAKCDLVRWRLHLLLADLTGELSHYYEATLACADLPASRAALGCALGRVGRAAEAVSHLRRAVAGNPLDLRAARALAQALVDNDDQPAAERVAAERRLLHQTAPQAVPIEPWFAEKQTAEGLASIIVLCCNQLSYTRLCIESVLRHTRPPYELILVDNGSTDDTPAYLEEISKRSEPARVAILRNPENKGFPAGCNQGLAAAKGDYVVFVNNDVVVAASWLDGLVQRANGGNVGLVGAVTNYAPDPQQVKPDYHDLAGLDAFAAKRRRDYSGRALELRRLTGFCLLARRAALDAVGNFDEGFGPGFFDDDDLCVRVWRAGFRLLVALEVYVHHFGSRTFTALGIDCTQQLQDNLARFREKWGPEEAAGYRPVAAESANRQGQAEAIGTASRPRVSLCLIVKNEAANIADCLDSAAGLADEVIVVDTGSTDRTRELAHERGARVFDFVWVDSFSAARNECLRHATGEWIFWLDADDRIDAENRERLRRLFASLGWEKAAYVLKCMCLPDAQTGTATVVDHVRLFRKDSGVRWEHRVHEQILPALRRLGHEVRWFDAVVHHTGYVDPALRGRKLERDLRLLHLEHQEVPHHPFTLFNLGSVYQDLGKHAEAVAYLRESLARSHPSDSIVRKVYALLAGCHRRLGQSAEALRVCGEGLGVCPDDAELLFLRALLWLEKGDLPAAEADLLQLLTSLPGQHFASVAAGLRGYKARQNLGVIYQRQGRLADAEQQWRAAAAERPDFTTAWEGLGELYLEQKRWSDLEKATDALDAAGAAVEAVVLRSRALLARREFEDARNNLESLLAQHPNAAKARLILSHVLLQEGKDLAAAERVLRQILQAEPGHVQVRQNLAALLREQGRSLNGWQPVEEVASAEGIKGTEQGNGRSQ